MSKDWKKYFDERSKLDPDTGCWNWTRACSAGRAVATKAGEGGKAVVAARFAYAKLKGPIPEGLWILHTCDNPKCVNPVHLYAGTRKDNTRDMVARGRAKGGGGPKLNPQLVKQIRQEYAEQVTQLSLAAKYGVSRENIRNIVYRLTWKEVE